MSNKKTSIILSVLVVGMIAIVFAATYSYFSGKVTNKDGDISISSGEIKLAISNSQIATSSLEPVYDSDINNSNKVYSDTFTVSRDASSTGNVCYNLKLVIDQIGTNLASMSSHIKYQISDGNTNVSGNLSSTNEKTIFTNQELTSNSTSKTYNIKVWLSYSDDINQTSMLESSTNSDRQLTMHLVADGTSGSCN